MESVAQPVRLCVCDTASAMCIPVHFQVEIIGNAIHIESDDVNELVAAIHTADDELQVQIDE